uniref:START domain-containing protein n=1 Tax=Caenorhabditis tropicalis TaxID=1561998 RepID=A0A1I7UYI4_9PELO
MILDLISTRRSYQTGKKTRNPIMPFPLDTLFEYPGDNKNPIAPEVKILCSSTFKKYYTSWRMNSFMKKLFDKKMVIPKNARVISIKMDGFVHGDECHSFIPVDGTVPGSYYTYQMFGANRIQMTCYVVDDVSYVAGFCIYFKDSGLRGSEFPTQIIRHAFNSVQKYVARRREPVLNVQQSDETIGLLPQHNNLGVVYCSQIGSNVVSSVDQGSVSHEEIDEKTKKTEMKKCLECSEQTEESNAPPAYSTLDNTHSSSK